MKKNKIKIIIVIVMLALGVSLIVTGVVFNSKKEEPTPIENNLDGELLGEERVKVQDEIVEVIEKYLADDTKIREYLDEKGERKITLKELKDNVKTDISAFEKLKYGCDSELTMIDFSEDYSKHTISLTCDALLKK